MPSGMVTTAVEGQAVPLYPGVPLRVKAGIIDGSIILALTLLLPVLADRVPGQHPELNMAALFGPVLLLEPLLVSFRGATIGQSMYRLSVLHLKSKGRCPLPNAFVRYVVKLLLGWLSMIYMLFSRRQQAIHDHLAGTVVVFTHAIARHRSTSTLPEQPMEQEDPQFLYPSGVRRFVVFLVWVGVALVPINYLGDWIIGSIEPACLEDHIPSEASTVCEAILVPMSLVFVWFLVQLAYWGATGRLPGAKRKRK